MYYLFGIISIAVYIALKYLLKMNMQISLLTAAVVGSLLARLPELQYRFFFAFGGVTDLLIKVALGLLIVILLSKVRFFSTSIKKIDGNISNSYINMFFKTIIFAIPGMISGSFIISGLVLNSNLELKEENSSFIWFASFIGVIFPPVNIYYQLLKEGLIGGYGFDGFNIVNQLLIVALVLLIITPLIFKKVDLNYKQVNGKISYFISGLFLLIFLLLEVVLRRFIPQILFPTILNFFFLFIIMSAIYLTHISRKPYSFIEAVKIIEKDFRTTLPYLFLILVAGVIMSLSVHTGFRGSLIVLLEGFTSLNFLLFLIPAVFIVALISPFLSLALIALPALFVSTATETVFMALVISIPLFYYIFKRKESLEGQDSLIYGNKKTSQVLVILITVVVWGSAIVSIF